MGVSDLRDFAKNHGIQICLKNKQSMENKEMRLTRELRSVWRRYKDQKIKKNSLNWMYEAKNETDSNC